MAYDYKQFDSQWGSHVISGTSSTMKSVGCGPTSIADILTDIIPPDVADYMGPRGFVGSSGSTYEGIIQTCARYGVGCTELTSGVSSYAGIAGQEKHQAFISLVGHLKTGKVAILLMGGRSKANAPDDYWTKGGHYVAAVRIKGSETVLIYDPGSSTRSGWYPMWSEGTGKLTTYTRRIFLIEGTAGSVTSYPDNYSGGSVLENDSEATGFSVSNLWNNITSTATNAWDSITTTAQGVIDSVNAFGDAISNLSNVISAIGEHFTGGLITASFEIAYKTVTTEIERDEIKTVSETNLDRTSSTKLLSYPSLVESPYVILTVGDYKFGTYSKEKISNKLNVNYPNYITGMTVTKINGQVNQYVINMVYQIQFGDDPNLLDRIFSTVGYGTVKISYGDWSSPTFVYKEEEAIITDLVQSVDFGNSRINYTLKCTSSSLVLASGYFTFPKQHDKPSNIIFSMLKDSKYGLQDVFTGMTNMTKVRSLHLIATDDMTVDIEAKDGMDALSYINYLVTCMCSTTSDPDSPLKDSSYYLTIHDDVYGEDELNGCYFKITKVESTTKTLATADTYEVDIGYPTENLVMSFNVLNNNSWALLYNYSEKVNTPEYVYSIDNDGQLKTEYSPAIAVSSKTFKMTEAQKTWWTNMTQFPINAELVIKGLVRPAMLMTYLRVNALFFGQRHISSGLYIITKQVDTIDGNGFRTKLSLLRIAGDDDYITKTVTQVTSNLPVSVTTVRTNSSSKSLPSYDEIQNKYSTNRANSTIHVSSSGIIHGGGGSGGRTFTITDDYIGNSNSTTHISSSGIIHGGGGSGGRTFGTSSSGGSNASRLWALLYEVIQNPYGVAGLMGNLYHESGLKCNKVENALRLKIQKLPNWVATYNNYGVNVLSEEAMDTTYTNALDSGALPKSEFLSPLSGEFFNDRTTHQYGYGLAQWTSSNRKEGLYNTAKSMGVSISSFEAQASWLCYELAHVQEYIGVYKTLRMASSIEDASDAVLYNFEQPRNPSQYVSERRTKSYQYYQQYKDQI